MKAKKLIKHGFDSMENHNPHYIIEERIFLEPIGEETLTAHGKIGNYLASCESEKRYLGYDGEVYPIYTIKDITIE